MYHTEKGIVRFLKGANKWKITRIYKEMQPELLKLYADQRSGANSPDFPLLPRLSEWAMLFSVPFSKLWRGLLFEIRVSEQHCPWTDKELKKLMQTKDKLKNAAA